MVIPNFFITFVRHSFPTSTPCTPPSRERRHRPAPPCHQAPHFPHAHVLPHALSARDCLTRCTSQGLCHTRHTHATHPRPHSTHALRATTPSQGLCHTHAPRAKCCNAFPCSPSTFREERANLHNQNITYYNITCNVYPNRSKDYTKKRGNLFLYRLNLLSLHDES